MSTADRPSVTDNARAEAEKAIEAIIDHSGDLPPGAPSRGARASNVVGTLIELGWAAGRAEPTTDPADLHDGYHSMAELYEYRMLYNAHAAHGWHAAGIPAVKSWKHSDGELCFGGGWFIVTATLPAGQVSNHYQADHWDLFQVPEVSLPPEWDGHTPSDAADRLREALHHLAITTGGWDAHAFAGALARTLEDE